MRVIGFIVVAFCYSAIFSGPLQAESRYFHGYQFEAWILEGHSMHRQFPLDSAGQRLVPRGGTYKIAVRNPLPVPVAVAVSVDGLNTIDGKSSSAAGASKWYINPYETIYIEGWQTSSHQMRRFVFTDADYSYAQWRENQEHRPYSRNIGVIGVAFFWNAEQLSERLRPRPRCGRSMRRACTHFSRRAESLQGDESSALRQEEQFGQKAGTGMGQRENNFISTRHLHINAGMYASQQAIRIYYRFDEPVRPQPFPEEPLRYQHRAFTPEM